MITLLIGLLATLYVGWQRRRAAATNAKGAE